MGFLTQFWRQLSSIGFKMRWLKFKSIINIKVWFIGLVMMGGIDVALEIDAALKLDDELPKSLLLLFLHLYYKKNNNIIFINNVCI